MGKWMEELKIEIIRGRVGRAARSWNVLTTQHYTLATTNFYESYNYAAYIYKYQRQKVLYDIIVAENGATLSW
jgi:hypothetical protein